MLGKYKIQNLMLTLPALFFVIAGCQNTPEPVLLNKAAEPRFHTIQVKAYDAAGKIGESSLVSVRTQ